MSTESTAHQGAPARASSPGPVAAITDRQRLDDVVHEHASLRDIAELAARGVPLPHLFQSVVDSALRVFDASRATLVGYEVGAGTGVIAVAVAPRVPAADAGRSPGAIARIRSAARYREEASITVEDRPWGVLAVDRISAPGDDLSSRLKPFADLTAIAIANARNRESLTRSRARIVAAGDDARRRLQRDLHDGAQQRLVHAILSLKLARETARAGEPVLDLLDEAIESAVDANRELRDLVRGILPAALSRAGLVGGIESFVSDVPLPVELRLSIPRLPPTLETTGYFLVAEALTNTVKHANATMARVEASIADEGEELVIVITDDGIGGADPGRGTGLTGLLDRVDAGGGALSIISPVGMGTTLTARLPLPSPGSTGASAPHPAD